MSTTDTALQVSRYVALDVHRSYLMVGAVDQQQQVVLTPRRFGFESFTAWAATHLSKSDAVEMSATANAWFLFDQLEPRVASVTVAHPTSREVEQRRTSQNRCTRYDQTGTTLGGQSHSFRLGSTTSGSRTARIGQPP